MINSLTRINMTQSNNGTNRISFRKRIFKIAKEIGRTLSSSSNLYEIEEDWGKLHERYKNKLTGGIKIYKEDVIGFKTEEEQLDILCTFKEQIKRQGFAFLPIYETENFISGIMYRSSDETYIDAAWNRIFYPNHMTELFKNGYDPVLAGVADILYDARSGVFINWDSRHRAVGQRCASEDQMPKFGFSNVIVIKSTAPTTGNKKILADVVACYLFEKKNDTPKALNAVERFVAEYRVGVESAIRAYVYWEASRLKLGNSSPLKELENAPDARILTGISLFRAEYMHKNLGQGRHITRACDSLRDVWSGAEAPEFSVYLVLGYCHLLQMDKLHNGTWGYDNDIMKKALRWAYEKKGLKTKDYCSPRASGKPFETVAFHFIRLAYNSYCEVHGMKDKVLSYEHFGFEDSFLETIGFDKESMKKKKDDLYDDDDMQPISESLGAESNFNHSEI